MFGTNARLRYYDTTISFFTHKEFYGEGKGGSYTIGIAN